MKIVWTVDASAWHFQLELRHSLESPGGRELGMLLTVIIGVQYLFSNYLDIV